MVSSQEDVPTDNVCLPYPLIKLPLTNVKTQAHLTPFRSVAKVLKRAKRTANDTLYSEEVIVGGLPPKLEESIPAQYLPEFLLVVANERCIEGNCGRLLPTTASYKPVIGVASSNAVTHHYKRLLPETHQSLKCAPTDILPTTATIWLSPDNLCGVGHHSSVHKAPFQLPEPLITNSRSPNDQVTLVAKLAFNDTGGHKPGSEEDSDREHLANEAMILDCLTRTYPSLQHDGMPNHHKGCPACCNDRTAHTSHPAHTTVAVVPKFYGYYVPEDETDKNASPILLLEDCGQQIVYENMTDPEKREIIDLFARLHGEAHLYHNSAAARNILVQPGPLCRPPKQRSLAYPSYRIIDFGRSDMVAPLAQYIEEDMEGGGCSGKQSEDGPIEQSKAGPVMTRESDAVMGYKLRKEEDWYSLVKQMRRACRQERRELALRMGIEL